MHHIQKPFHAANIERFYRRMYKLLIILVKGGSQRQLNLPWCLCLYRGSYTSTLHLRLKTTLRRPNIAWTCKGSFDNVYTFSLCGVDRTILPLTFVTFLLSKDWLRTWTWRWWYLDTLEKISQKLIRWVLMPLYRWQYSWPTTGTFMTHWKLWVYAHFY